MDAMASRRAQGTRGRLAQLWQLPLLAVSLGLFAYAAYLFIDPQPGPTIEQRIGHAEVAVRNDRHEAALELLRSLRAAAAGKFTKGNDARVHLLQAEAIAGMQRQKKLDLAANHAEIIEHTKAALIGGMEPDAAIERRLGESYEALGRVTDALDHYRAAIAFSPDKAPALRRKVIDLQLGRSDTAALEASLDEYLEDDRLADAERTWAAGEKSRLLVDRGDFAAARAMLAGIVRADGDPVAQGQVHYRLGYCEWKLGNTTEAERLLRVARDQLRVRQPLDADAARLLGRILQDRGEAREALAFYQDVIVSHPDALAAPLARLGRGVCRVEVGEDLAGLTDLTDLVNEVAAKPSRERYKGDVLTGLRRSSRVLSGRGNFQGAMEVLALEQTLDPEPPADFFARLGAVYERRADQVERTVAAAPDDAERVRRGQQVRELRTKAGDAAIAYSRALTVGDDKGHAEALWKGIDLYDRAGDLARGIGALEQFAAERPDDGQTPDALLRLGRTYQAAGQFDKAVAAFQRTQFRYGQSLAASRAGVPLAQAYIAKGPDFYPKAEAALLATLDSHLITPDAEDFKDALFELAQLYYRTERYEEAVNRLEEMTERYPADGRVGQLYFLMADSYRKSAALLKEGKGIRPAPAAATASAGGTDAAGVATQLAAGAEAAAQRRERLGRAKGLYDRVIERSRDAPPARDVDKLHVKLAHFYRADCLYDNGSYEEAIRLYDAAALRYQDDPSALAAYVQIVNAYCALGRAAEARAANERARWLLRRIPPQAFKDGGFSMPKEYWDDWLKWSGEAAMW
jgi:tetratricopeptide (TPR) repeat protein